MRRESGMVLAVVLVALAATAGCNKGADGPDLSKLGPSSAATTTILPVGSQLCPGGGIGIYTGSDGNNNGVLEASEVQKGTPVCAPVPENGKPGGLASLVVIASEPTGTLHCAAGGLKVLSGADTNGNGALDAPEVLFTEYLCNGAPGSSSAAGITVASAPPVPVDMKKDRKGKKPATAKKPAAAAGKAPGKAAVADKSGEKARPTSSNREKKTSANPVASPKGWTTVKSGSSPLASAAYKIEGKYIILRFTNLSATSGARCKYTVRWKMNQNGGWVDDSTMEGLTVRLNPGESLDREIRTQAQEIRDVVVELNITEGS